jgi:hypothetical protein
MKRKLRIQIPEGVDVTIVSVDADYDRKALNPGSPIKIPRRRLLTARWNAAGCGRNPPPRNRLCK